MRKKAWGLLAAGTVICVGISGCGGGRKTPQEYPADMASLTGSYRENAAGEKESGGADTAGNGTEEGEGTAGGVTAESGAAAENVPVLEGTEEIKGYLAEFPVSGLPEELSGQPCYVIAHGEEKSGRGYADAFMEKVQANESAALVLVQYTEEGDPVLDYLSYDGEYFYRIHDSSRDDWAGDEKYREYIYTDVWTGLGNWEDIRDGCDMTERGEEIFYVMYADNSYQDGLPEALFCAEVEEDGEAARTKEEAGEGLSAGSASPSPNPCPEETETAVIID